MNHINNPYAITETYPVSIVVVTQVKRNTGNTIYNTVLLAKIYLKLQNHEWDSLAMEWDPHYMWFPTNFQPI